MPDADGSGGGGDDEGRDRDDRDPTRVATIAVHADDVVSALATNRRGATEGRAVLRVTPPFSGRMRARIHLDQGEDDGTWTIPPERLVDAPPEFPEPDDTADALRADPDAEYTPERHRRRHERAVEEWRTAVADRIVDRVALADDHTVDVVVIGQV